MSEELKVLLLEDNAADAELTMALLRKSDMKFIFKRVETKNDFAEQLDVFNPDLILADYNLPSFDGLAALNLAKEKYPGTPFIIISGAIGEEIAIEALKQGATDYLLKERLTRLVASVKKALEASEEKIKLKNIEKRFYDTMETMSEGCMIIGFDWTYIYANPAAAYHGRVVRESLAGKKMTEVYPGIEKSPIFAAYKQCMDTRLPQNIESEFTFPDGSSGWYEMKVSPVKEGIFVLSSEITERVKAQELIYQADLVNNVSDAVISTDGEMTIKSWNKAAEKIYGWTAEEAIGKKVPILLRSEFNDNSFPGIASVLKEKNYIEIEITHLHKNGARLHVLSSITALRDDKGMLTGTIGIIHDFTERREKEEKLKKLNQTLRAIGNSNQAIMRASSEAELLQDSCNIIIKDCGYKMVWIGFARQDENKSVTPEVHCGFEAGYLETLKFTWEDNELGRGPTGTAIRTRKPVICRNILTDPKFEPWRKEALKRGYASSVVFPLIEKDKAFGAVNIYSEKPEAFSDDEIQLLTELSGDISHGIISLRLRRALSESEKLYHALFNTMGEGFCIIKMIFDAEGKPADYRFLETNAAFENQTGLHNAKGKLMRELAPAHEEHWFEMYGKVAMTGEPAHFIDEARALNRFYDVSAYRVGAPEGRQVAIIFNDVSKQKQVEIEREASVNFLQIMNQSGSLMDIVKSAIEFFYKESGCEAVGIRLKTGEDYPYFETKGFSQDFLLAERSLCERDEKGNIARDKDFNPIIECMCGDVICGRFDPGKEFFTTHGSFWSNNTTRLLASTTDEERQARTRNRCNGEGYESVALIPLHVNNTQLGLLQLNDKRPGRFAPGLISLWERLADYLAIAIEKVRLQEALRLSEVEFAGLFSNMTEGMAIHEIVRDPSGKPVDYILMDVNPAFELITGMKKSEVKGKKASEIYGTREAPFLPIYEKVASSGNPRVFETFFPPMNKHFNISVFSHEKGKFATIFQDITKRKKAEEVLLRDQETLKKLVDESTDQLIKSHEEMDKLRRLSDIGELAATVAHELRNPLAVIKMSAYNLQRKVNKPEFEKHFGNITKKIDESNQIINNLLSFSKTKPPSYEPVNIFALLNECLESEKERYPRQKIKIIDSYAGLDGVKIEADPFQLKSVIINVLNNAYEVLVERSAGKIEVAGKIKDGSLDLVITDNGPGIDKENMGRIFEPFFSTKAKGTGLGLAVCRQIIELHNGTINIQSEKGKGTTVNITLPVKKG